MPPEFAQQGFDYDSDRERIGVITEYTIFALHVADRVVHPTMNSEAYSSRRSPTGSQHLCRKPRKIAGPGNYRSPIAVINARGVITPTYTRRYAWLRLLPLLGAQVLDQMGETQTNRWVIDQVMELDAPELFDKARKAVEELFDSGHHSGDEEG